MTQSGAPPPPSHIHNTLPSPNTPTTHTHNLPTYTHALTKTPLCLSLTTPPAPPPPPTHTHTHTSTHTHSLTARRRPWRRSTWATPSCSTSTPRWPSHSASQPPSLLHHYITSLLHHYTTSLLHHYPTTPPHCCSQAFEKSAEKAGTASVPSMSRKVRAPGCPSPCHFQPPQPPVRPPLMPLQVHQLSCLETLETRLVPSHPGTFPSPPQVRLWPAWKCVVRVDSASLPGTSTPFRPLQATATGDHGLLREVRPV